MAASRRPRHDPAPGLHGAGCALVISSLGLASTLSIDSRVKTGILKSQYSGIGGLEHALYRLLNEEVADPEGGPDPIPWRDTLEIGVPAAYSIGLNGQPTDITVEKVSAPKGIPPSLPPLGSESSRPANRPM